MKKMLAFLLLTFVASNSCVFAITNTQDEVVAPKWEDYIPAKYQNPRNDFTRGGSIAELSVGILLTDLILTAPIGIPMIVHSSTKLKNLSYYDKKEKFEAGLAEAEQIVDAQERQIYYDQLLCKCKMTEKMRQKQAKKQAKEGK